MYLWKVSGHILTVWKGFLLRVVRQFRGRVLPIDDIEAQKISTNDMENVKLSSTCVYMYVCVCVCVCVHVCVRVTTPFLQMLFSEGSQ